MNRNALERLIDAAQRAHKPAAKEQGETAPPGFASRVVATARAEQKGPGTLDLLERFGWCGAATSAAICLVAVGLHSREPGPNPFDVFVELPVAAVESPLSR